MGDVSLAVGTVGPVRGTDSATEDRDSRRGNDSGGRRTGHGRPIIRRTGPVVRPRGLSALVPSESSARALSEGKEGQLVADQGRPGGSAPCLVPKPAKPAPWAEMALCGQTRPDPRYTPDGM